MNGRSWRRYLAAISCMLMLWMGIEHLAQAQSLSAEPIAVQCSEQQQTKQLVPVGQAVGIKLFSHGVMVIGLEDIKTEEGDCSPAKRCGLKIGDIITDLGGTTVNTIEQMQEVLQAHEGEKISVVVLRGGKRVNMWAKTVACLADGRYKLGAWVRDSMAGIGTVTWYDPQSKRFCALGHGVNDVDTGLLMPLKNGAIMPASVTGVIAGCVGSAGQLHGTFDLSRDLGTLTENTDCGVFGQLYGDEFNGKAIPIAGADEVKTGAAVILSCVSGEEVREYSVEILRIYPATASETRNLMIQVTDTELLSKTGGIVQGQSGSPILQNGKLVGAVTHVLVNDPTRGYGILVENMLSGE